MLLEIVTSLGFVIPPEKSSRIKSGNLYIRRTSHGNEFVRKQEQHRGKMEHHGRSKPQRRCTMLGKEELRILERKQQLQQQLAVLEKEQAKIEIGRHEYRPWHLSTGVREPREAQQAESPRRARTERRRSFEVQIDMPDLHYTEYQSRPHHPRRPSYHDTHADMVYHSSGSPSREHCVRNASPKTSRQHCGRRSSWERWRPHQHYEEVPLICERVVERDERRKSMAESCCRRRSRHHHSEEDYDWEIRVPEDYWLDDY